MKTTYLTENTYTGTVYGYYHTLSDAKDHLKSLARERHIEHNAGVLCILCLKGHEFGEGFHKYRCYYNIDKDKFEYIRY